MNKCCFALAWPTTYGYSDEILTLMQCAPRDPARFSRCVAQNYT